MPVKSNSDELVDIPYSAHKSLIYQIMKLVRTNLYSGKNRTAVIDGNLDITNMGPSNFIQTLRFLKNHGALIP